MANTIENGQTCLEKRGMEERHEEIVRNDYKINDQYSDLHQDAISNGGVQGKGHPTVKGHTHYLPDCTQPVGRIEYKNFATDPKEPIGGCLDINGYLGRPGRKEQMDRSIYNYEKPYGSTLVDTTANVEDGQVVVKTKNKEKIIC